MLLDKAGRLLRILKAARVLLVLLLLAEAAVVYVSTTEALHWGWGAFAVVAAIPTTIALVLVHSLLRSRLRAWVEGMGKVRKAQAEALRDRTRSGPSSTSRGQTREDVLDAEWEER